MGALASVFYRLAFPAAHLAPATAWLSLVSPLAADALASSLWQGTILAIATWVILRLLSGISASARFAIWGAVFLFIVLLPLASLHPARAYAAGASAGLLHLDARWSLGIVSVWAIASIIRLGRLATGAFHLRSVWRRALPIAGAEDFLSDAEGRVQVCTSVDIDRPSVIGFLAPRILIPADLAGTLSSEELEQIVLHEAGHLRRRDDWMNLVQKVVLAAMPFNPALAWVERRMCLERELACDDSVLVRTRAPRAYALCLTNLAGSRIARRAAALSLGAWGRRSELARRVESILAGDWQSSPRRVSVTSGVLAAIFAGAVGLSRCPLLVTFNAGSALQPIVASSGYSDAPSRAGLPATLSHAIMAKVTMPVSAQAPALVGDGVQTPVRSSFARKIKRGRNAPALLRTSAKRGIYQMHGMSQPIPMRARAFVVFAPITGNQIPADMILTVSDDGRLTRAAVPTPDGWLVIQL